MDKVISSWESLKEVGLIYYLETSLDGIHLPSSTNLHT